MPKETAPAPETQIQIEIDEAASKGCYANLAFISHSETEFILDFALLQPQTPKAKVVSRVVTSPAHMKRLLAAMQDNIRKYESRFGPITLRDEAPQPKGTYH